MNSIRPLYIYNLYPLLYRNTAEWTRSLDAIVAMGFNSIYLNPFHETGASGSIYAVKDFYRYNPRFFINLPHAEDEIKHFLEQCRIRGLDVFMDLVVNHSAIDSSLITQHPDWYVHDERGAVVKPVVFQDWTWKTWEDLAKFDFDTSSDREALWDYHLQVCRHYLELGFTGFRCDAANHVSLDFWAYLIGTVKSKFPDVLFLAESFMCSLEETLRLAEHGFDYIFNSARWWNFEDPWCLEQYTATSVVAPSIAFPETHDTPRLMEEVDGNETAFLQRLYFTAIFSKGFMIISGVEHGLTKRLNVATTQPEDWETIGHDYSEQIRTILDIKKKLQPLHEESQFNIIHQQNLNVLCFTKVWQDSCVLVALNKDIYRHQLLSIPNIDKSIPGGQIVDCSPGTRIPGIITNQELDLAAGELKIFASE